MMIMVIIISFMQRIYTYIPQTNYVPREYSVAANLLLLILLLLLLSNTIGFNPVAVVILHV